MHPEIHLYLLNVILSYHAGGGVCVVVVVEALVRVEVACCGVSHEGGLHGHAHGNGPQQRGPGPGREELPELLTAHPKASHVTWTTHIVERCVNLSPAHNTILILGLTIRLDVNSVHGC